MLRPFKSFFNNLQKNAIGASATIFGILPDMTNNPEAEEEEINDSSIMYNSENMDPLADPLALDDELINSVSESGSEYQSMNTTLSDIDGSDDGQIILVDVNSLKNAYTFPVVSYATSSPTPSPTTSLDSSGIGGCDDHVQIENEQLNSRIIVNNYGVNSVENDILLSSTDNVQSVTSLSDEIGMNFEPITLTLDDGVIEEVIEEGVRSDGSDSGLGLELNASLTPNRSALSTGSRSNLKRRSDTCDGPEQTVAKKSKRNIQFNSVTVYYFPRIQGFTCVPSQGGCTLGMGPRHYDQKTFTLAEHYAEQKRLHRQQVLELSPRNSTPTLTPTPTTSTANSQLGTNEERTSSEDSDSEEDLLSDNSGSEYDTETNGFLQPVPQRQRRALLKAAGIREIVSGEKNECRDIRTSREFCGCSCRGYCDPDTCFCSQSGIKCQVDRASFPCGCTQDGCGNVFGRIEFNPKRVRTHFIHTIMRLELEKKQSKSDNQLALNSYDGRLPSGSQQAAIECNSSSNSVFASGSTDVVDNHQCNSNYNNSIINSNCSYTSTIAKPPLDLHYAFRNDYQTDIPTQLTSIQQTYNDQKQHDSQLLQHQQQQTQHAKEMQQNYSMYASSDYYTNDNYDGFSSAASNNQELSAYAGYTNGDPFLVSESNGTMCLNSIIDTSASCSNHLVSFADSVNGTAMTAPMVTTSTAFTSDSQAFTMKSTEPNSDNIQIHQYFNSNVNNLNNNNNNSINSSKSSKHASDSDTNSLVKATTTVYESTLMDLDKNHSQSSRNFTMNGSLATNHNSTSTSSLSVPLLMETQPLPFFDSINGHCDLNHSNHITNADVKPSALHESKNCETTSNEHCKNSENLLKNSSKHRSSTTAAISITVSSSRSDESLSVGEIVFA